jgi:hypothetical protein
MEEAPGDCHRHRDICAPHVPEAVHIFRDELIVQAVRIPREGGHRFRRKAATQSDRKRPPNPNEGGHPVDGVMRGALSAV